MLENTAEIHLIATDEATPTIERVAATNQRAMAQMGMQTRDTTEKSTYLTRQWENLTSTSNSLEAGFRSLKMTLDSVAETYQRAMAQMGVQTRDTTEKSTYLTRQWENLTSASHFLGAGLRFLRATLDALVWGTIIGAVAALIPKFMEWAFHTEEISKQTENLIHNLTTQINILDPMRSKTEALIRADFELAKVQFELNKALATTQLLKTIDELARLGKEAQGNFGIVSMLKIAWQQMFTPLGDHAAMMQVEEKAMRDAGLQGKVLGLQLTILNGLLTQQAPTWDQYTGKLTEAGRKYGALNEEEQKGLAIALPLAGSFAIVNKSLADNQLLLENVNKWWGYFYNQEGKVQDQLDKQFTEDYAAVWIKQTQAIHDVASEHDQWLQSLKDETQYINILTGAYGPYLQQMAIENAAFEMASKLKQVGVHTLEQYILGQSKLGAALKTALAQTLAQIAAESAVRAIFETAMGFAALFVNPPAAAAHFQAAGLFAAVGGAAGVAARGLALSGSFGSGLIGSPSNPAVTMGSTMSVGTSFAAGSNLPPPQAVTIIIQGNIIGQEKYVNEELIPAIEEAVRNERSSLALKGP